MAAAARAWTAALAVVLVGVGVVTAPSPSQAAPPVSTGQVKVDRTLGNGLGRLLATDPGAGGRRAAPRTGPRADPVPLTITDAQGRLLVDLTPAAGVDPATFRRAAEAAGLDVQSTDPRRGTLEGFVELDRVPTLSGVPGRGTLAQAVRPRPSAGSATSRGVPVQRVDRVQRRGVDGAGVTIAALSDSYDAASTTLAGNPLRVHAADDVARGDLPGAGNAAYPTPVDVLQDHERQLSPTDEGRAMLQIAHDVAPGAKLCFATGQVGEVGFAENIRRLADEQGSCGADVIVDDLVYFDEPMFSDGIVSDAVDEVAAQGVHYFSSAGNGGSNQAWDSPLDLVPVSTGLAGTNLDLTDVDPGLYDGGFQDMAPGAGVDITQDVVLSSRGGLLDLQWDDPVDLDGPTLGEPYLDVSGTVTSSDPAPTFTFTPSPSELGTDVQFRADGVPSGSTDLKLTVTAPDGTVLASVDDGVYSAEVFTAQLEQAGDYRVEVSGFEGETGDFTLAVRPVLQPSAVSTDLNVLFFDPEGRFLGTSADVNTLTGRPLELAPFPAAPRVQVVVSRSGQGAPGARRVRAALFGGAELAEHVDPAAPNVFGHATARGATAVAAYDPFRPFLPEAFTAPGGRLTVVYDSSGRRLSKSSQGRLVPQVAGADGGNTTFFGTDTPADLDSQPNFYGTSAAAPHVAGIAALVVQRTRQQGKRLSPTALRTRLRTATYTHDLDPFRAQGRTAGVSLSAAGAQSAESALVAGSMTDTHVFTLRNVSGRTMRSVTLDGSTASPTAPGFLGARDSAGIVFDPRPFDATRPRADVGFPFAIGATGGGLQASTVRASYSRPTGPGRFRRLTLTFSKGFKRGQRLEFGIDRDLASSADGSSAEGNGADELGGATMLPTGTKDRSGLTFVVRRTSGKKSTAQLRNKLGHGFTVVDGYGLVDAEKAVVGR